jgi:hypothetical protein
MTSASRFDPFAALLLNDRYLRILAVAVRTPKGRNPPFAAFHIAHTNGREARESGLRLEA